MTSLMGITISNHDHAKAVRMNEEGGPVSVCLSVCLSVSLSLSFSRLVANSHVRVFPVVDAN